MGCQFLVIRWSGMGDIIMTLPAIKWLKDHFDDCQITYLTDTAFAGIVEKSGLVDRIAKIDRRGFAVAGRFAPALAGTVSSLFRMRRQKVHKAFDLQGFGETAILAYLSGAPVRVGRVKESPLRRRIYNSPILADWEREHRTRYFVRAVAEACGAQAPETIDPPRLIVDSGSSGHSPAECVGLNIGASTESRRWSEENYFELAQRLAKRNFAIRIFLGPQEKFLVEKTQKICLENNWDFSIHRRIAPLIEALSGCRLLVSNDTGPGHLAAALDVPVITLFSTGTPENVRPLARKAAYFRDKEDINRIGVSAVEKACVALLESAPLKQTGP